MKDVFDRLVQLLSPFGIDVEMDTSPGRRVDFYFGLVTRASASDLRGEKFSLTCCLDERDLVFGSREFTRDTPGRVAVEKCAAEKKADAPHVVAG